MMVALAAVESGSVVPLMLLLLLLLLAVARVVVVMAELGDEVEGVVVVVVMIDVERVLGDGEREVDDMNGVDDVDYGS